ncbi:MAG: hypothetical protein R2932_03410 [Caldilineaceae bacterium]
MIVSNADPRVTLRLLGPDADAHWQQQVEAVPIKGYTAKVSVVLRIAQLSCPSGLNEPHHSGQINTPLTKA